MASHVVVIDSTARRTIVKTTPNKPMSDVLEEACTKFGITASQYGLKNNNKQVDLSRTFRLSGLSSGAKLELVQLSKSAGVVSVALQLPESEARGVPNARLTDKFPSTTTLWLVLRKFEAGVAGGGGTTSRNLTARGVPSTQSGAGRMCYEQPVLQVMNRELASFTDLQKTLAQLGLNSGSALMRLNFRPSETPLEEAMEQIQKYFDSVDGTTTTQPTQPQQNQSVEEQLQTQPSQPSSSQPVDSTTTTSTPQQSTEPATTTTTSEPQIQSSETEPPTTPLTKTSSGRPVSVYRPPSSSAPSATLLQHRDSDYTPTVEHAQIHQKLLAQSSRNIRLPNEAEIAAQAEEDAARIAAIKEVEIKVRFPDQSAVSSKFGQKDTGADLYNFVRECLEEQFRNEIFQLRNPGIRGKGEIVPDDKAKLLIKNLSLKGRVLVVFGWDDSKASMEARAAKNVLKQELRAQAEEIKVQDVTMTGAQDDDPGVRVNTAKQDSSKDDGDEGGAKKKMPKWLKGLAKK